eukprot:CAMPEP_0168278582 /NCGR_PEP_ID=MMETSP0141_2-20121125/19958_1 /TAXON_ID=44445 /ORGANISM="Pseudo-nitzschia australis, Strain 10249 10 AB" /LENGTH=125 /DNA_ID=CAMNT_0008221345 /DNA_START=148 /DNA_END=522 /DNA_ORIENTATION=-
MTTSARTIGGMTRAAALAFRPPPSVTVSPLLSRSNSKRGFGFSAAVAKHKQGGRQTQTRRYTSPLILHDRDHRTTSTRCRTRCHCNAPTRTIPGTAAATTTSRMDCVLAGIDGSNHNDGDNKPRD